MDLTKFEGHTPGPWEWIGYDLESEKGTPMEVTVRCGQYCQGGSPHVDITDADHALIAAAPELLEEVTRLRAENERLRFYVEADACCPCCGELQTCFECCSFADDCPDGQDRMNAARAALYGNKADKPGEE